MLLASKITRWENRTSALRARKLLNRHSRIGLEACFKIREPKQTVANSSCKKQQNSPA